MRYITFIVRATQKMYMQKLDVLANLQQFQYLVPETSVTHLPSDTLILCDTIVLPVFSILESVARPEYIIKWTFPEIFTHFDVQVS